MNTNIKIIADSTCDLPQEFIKKYDISIIPLCIIMDDKSYYDGVEVTPQEIFQWADENKKTPKTAAVTFERGMEIIKPFTKEKKDIIFFGISTKFSTTCNVIRLIGEELEYDRIFIIDSMNLSTGIGIQVLNAAEMVQKGMTAEKIVENIKNLRKKVRASFVIDTVLYLARGGRCSAVTALLADTLKLKPVIVVRDGEMGVSKKYRGNTMNVLMKWVRGMENELRNADPARVFIVHSGCDGQVLDWMQKYFNEMKHFDEIIEAKAGGVISSHCGPNTLGIMFYKN